MEDIRKSAESIIDGLSNLENRTNTIAKIADSYREFQIEIVLNHLRQLTSQSSGRDNSQDTLICMGCHKLPDQCDCLLRFTRETHGRETELLRLAKRLADYVRMTIEIGELKPESPIGIAYRDFMEELVKPLEKPPETYNQS